MPQPHPTWKRVGGILVSMLLATSAINPSVALAAQTKTSKSETVHVSVDASGEVKEIKVESLVDGPADEPLEDLSTLQDISPKDEEDTFVQNGESLVWTTPDGKVTYEGTSEQAVPVEVKVSYTLDGKTVTPDQLADASGHLVVRFDYKNNSTYECTIGGKQETIHTPFVCMSAALLDSKIFSNVEVTNGRVIEDKGGLAVIGYAMPGLSESLGDDVDELDVDIPEYVEFSADVEDLVLDPIYTIVTPELFDSLDSSALDLDLGDIDEGSDALSDAMGKLIEGSGSLGGALGQLADGSSQLGGGMAELKKQLGLLPEGVAALSGGADTLSSGLGVAAGVSEQLSGGASSIKDATSGAKELVSGAAASVDGAQTAIGEASGALAGVDGTVSSAATVKDAASAVSGAATAANESLGEAASNLDTAQGGIEGAQSVLSGLTDEQREALGDALPALEEQLTTAQTGVSGAREAQTKATDQLQAANEATSTLVGVADQLDTVSAASSTVQGKLADAATAAAGAAQGLAYAQGALEPLAEGAQSLSDGASTLADQLGQASGGAQTLAEQLSTLSTQAPMIVTGVDVLGTGIDQLSGALSATADGSNQLTEGLRTFDSEGIQELLSSLKDFSSSFDGASDRMDALRDAAKAYDTFAGKVEGQDGSVRFIYKTEQIG